MKKDKINLKFWEKILLVSTILLFLTYLIFSSISSKENNFWLILLSCIAAFCGIMGVFLAERRKAVNYYVGGVHVILYGLLAFNAAIYGDFLLNIFYFLPFQFAGYFLWKKNEDKVTKKIKIKKVNWSKKIFYFYSLSFFIFYFIFFIFLLKFTNDPYPLIDASSTSFSILGMQLMIFGFWEQWIAWIIVNIVTIIIWTRLFINTNSYSSLPLLYMWIIYLGISITGLVKWRNKYKELLLINTINVNIKIPINFIFEETKYESYLLINKMEFQDNYHLKNSNWISTNNIIINSLLSKSKNNI